MGQGQRACGGGASRQRRQQRDCSNQKSRRFRDKNNALRRGTHYGTRRARRRDVTHRVTASPWIQAQRGAEPAIVVTTQELKMPMLSSGRNGESAWRWAESRARVDAARSFAYQRLDWFLGSPLEWREIRGKLKLTIRERLGEPWCSTPSYRARRANCSRYLPRRK
jgi:hypothetical protein